MPSLLCFNAGSSSLKFALFDADSLRTDSLPSALLRGEIDAPNGQPVLQWQRSGQSTQTLQPGGVRGDIGSEVAWLLDWLGSECRIGQPAAVAHRIVHGGLHYTEATLIDNKVAANLHALQSLAPLHQGPGLAGVQAAQAALPQAAQIACFDTAFHARQSAVERRYAIPQHWHDCGAQRYGFHGLSYDAIAHRLPALLGPQAQGAVVVAHLGSGASVCGLRKLRSVTTTMGYTALDGLVMGTRCGSIDPGLLLHWLQQDALTAADVEHMLYHDSGLLGVSGISADPRVLLASPAPEARLAIDVFVHSVVRHIGAVAATLGGLDALVFTGGIGTHQPPIRDAVVQHLAWLGLALDPAANTANQLRISSSDSRIPVLAVPTDEEAVMALQAAELLGFTHSNPPTP